MCIICVLYVYHMCIICLIYAWWCGQLVHDINKCIIMYYIHDDAVNLYTTQIYLCIICIIYVYYMCNIYDLYVYYMCIICVLYVYYMCIVCMMMCSICTWYIWVYYIHHDAHNFLPTQLSALEVPFSKLTSINCSVLSLLRRLCSPKTTQMSRGLSPTVEWAAVSYQSLLIRIPPQKWLPRELVRETCQGSSLGRASFLRRYEHPYLCINKIQMLLCVYIIGWQWLFVRACFLSPNNMSILTYT